MRTILMICFFFLSTISFAHQNNHVAIFSSPFRGHINVMLEMAKLLSQKNIRISFYLSSWSGLENLNEQAKQDIASIPNCTLVDLEQHYEKIPPLDPLTRCPMKVAALLEPSLDAIKKDSPRFIIFDMLAPEAKLIGKLAHIPTISVGAAMVPPKKYAQKKNLNEIWSKDHLEKIFSFSGLKLEGEIIAGAALPFVLGDKTYLLTLPAFHNAIEDKISDGFEIGFIGPRRADLGKSHEHPSIAFIEQQKNDQKKIIYLSLGTIVTQKIYQSSEQGRDFVNKIFRDISFLITQQNDLALVISCGETAYALVQYLAGEKIAVFSDVPQLEVLRKTDLFITHGGANSINEAALEGVPMLVIPFFDDQHFCAQAVERTGLGRALAHPEEIICKAMSPLSGIYDRESFDTDHITQIINELLADEQKTRSQNFKTAELAKDRMREFVELIARACYIEPGCLP